MEFLYETHMHTSQVSACAVSTAEQQVLAYKNKGYTGIIITDHFVNGNSTCPADASWSVRMKHFHSGFEAAKRAGDECGLDVFFGWEYTIRGLDFLTYGLGLDFLLAHHELYMLSIEEYSALVHDSGGYIAQAHPYRAAWYIEYSMPVEPHLLDGIEVYNSMDSTESNKNALAYAERHNLPMQAGSDSHSVKHARYSGIVLDRKANDIHDIIQAVKAKEVRLVSPH